MAEIGAHGVVAGPDASLHLQPAQAIKAVCDKDGISPADLDLLEINEAFRGGRPGLDRRVRVSEDVVNVNGGAIALGHPLGMSGARVILSLALNRRRGGAFGRRRPVRWRWPGDALSIVRVP